MDKFYLEFLKYQENYTPYDSPSHTHTCHELVYYISGSGITMLDDKEYEYHPQTFTIIPPNQKHSEKACEDTKLIFIGFSYHGKEVDLPAGIFIELENNFVYEHLNKMEEELDRKKPFYGIMLNNLTQSLFIKIMRTYVKNQSGSDDYCIRYAQKYIEENFKGNLNLKELAEMSGYSYDWFRHLFKEKCGYTLTQYILKQKLQNAALLLSSTDKTIAEIANECLFSSSSQFISLFKRNKKLTPKEYRMQVRNKDKIRLYYD